MEILHSSDFTETWIANLQRAAERHPAILFDGRISLPEWLIASARDQAERVFLIFDGTPVEDRDLEWAEQVIERSQIAYLDAWGSAMTAFQSVGESWAHEAAEAAGDAFHDRLKCLVVRLYKGGTA